VSSMYRDRRAADPGVPLEAHLDGTSMSCPAIPAVWLEAAEVAR
jgi:hypothetical protein